MISDYLEWRRTKKAVHHLLHHARLCRHLREDVAQPGDLERLAQAEHELAGFLETRDRAGIDQACQQLDAAAQAVSPPRPMAAFRENLEILVVAFAVAMAFRTYFVQPFKIPTGSMQPTLYGIHYEPCDGPGITDAFPVKPLKWLLLGKWYCEFPALASGVLRGPVGQEQSSDGNMFVYEIGGIRHAVPMDLQLGLRAGDEVMLGQMLARGVRITGDHIFVNKVKWNFCKPQRGAITVFRTDDLPIPHLNGAKTHYIKRLVGLPGETLAIDAPFLRINGEIPPGPDSIVRIMNRDRDRTGARRYAGYGLADGPDAKFLNPRTPSRELGPGEYLCFGDNTRNSLDGRYWGPVPEANLVGPAWLVYWPISKRWGLAR